MITGNAKIKAKIENNLSNIYLKITTFIKGKNLNY